MVVQNADLPGQMVIWWCKLIIYQGTTCKNLLKDKSKHENDHPRTVLTGHSPDLIPEGLSFFRPIKTPTKGETMSTIGRSDLSLYKKSESVNRCVFLVGSLKMTHTQGSF